jgi:hypothetical protein
MAPVLAGLVRSSGSGDKGPCALPGDDRRYQRRRRQRRLGKLTPVEYETINQAAHAA